MQRRARSVRRAAVLAAAVLAAGLSVSAPATGATAATPAVRAPCPSPARPPPQPSGAGPGPASATAAARAAAADGWTGTWSVSPQSGGPSYTRQTLRQIVHTGVGGSSARLRISNAFGPAPLTVADVHVAQRTSGSSVNTGTDRAVTFGGQSSVTVPAGGSAVSDAVAFAVPALSDVAVSLYLPQPTGSATYHQQGTQTTYLAAYDAGDHLHANEAGLQAIADSVNLSLFGPPGGPAGSWIALRARANGKFVTAPNGGASALIANRDAVGPWEEFGLVMP